MTGDNAHTLEECQRRGMPGIVDDESELQEQADVAKRYNELKASIDKLIELLERPRVSPLQGLIRQAQEGNAPAFRQKIRQMNATR